jgi:hypothetical protein
VAWKNTSTTTRTIKLLFWGSGASSTIAVSSIPGINTYNGSCGSIGAAVTFGWAINDAALTGLDPVEFRMGR